MEKRVPRIEDQTGAFPMNCSRLGQPKPGPRVNSNNKSARGIGVAVPLGGSPTGAGESPALPISKTGPKPLRENLAKHFKNEFGRHLVRFNEVTASRITARHRNAFGELSSVAVHSIT